MHISILTASGKYNLGDELILSEEFHTLKKAYPNATFSIFTYDEKSCIFADKKAKFISFFPNRAKSEPLKNIKYLIQNIITIAKSDCIVIGGGGLIYDRETQSNMFPLKQWLFRVLIAKLFRTPIIWWSVGINVAESTKGYLPFLFRGKKTIVTVRDKKSREVLASLGIEGAILPDPVLGYEGCVRHVVQPMYAQAESASPEHRVDSEINSGGHKKTVGISLRSSYRKNDEFFTQILEYLREKNYNIIFLSQSIHPEDTKANDMIFSTHFSKPSDKITQSLTETLEIYPELDFVIGMRLHSLILATVHAIPFLALSYETKTQELLHDLAYDYMLNVKKGDFVDFQRKFSDLEKQAKEVKFALGAKNDTIKQQLREGTKKLLSNISALIQK